MRYSDWTSERADSDTILLPTSFILYRVNACCTHMIVFASILHILAFICDIRDRIYAIYSFSHLLWACSCAWLLPCVAVAAITTTIDIDKSFTRCLVVNVVEAFAQLLTRSKRQLTLSPCLRATLFPLIINQSIFCRVIVASNACNRINSIYTFYKRVSQAFVRNSINFHITFKFPSVIS